MIKSIGSLGVQESNLNLINQNNIHTKTTANKIINDERLDSFSQSLKQGEDIFSHH